MKQSQKPKARRISGVTLLEMTVVILVLLTLLGVGVLTSSKIGEWKLGREAGEVLRSVHAAQRMYLADRPTTVVSAITADDLLPYMQGNLTAMPTVKSLDGAQLEVIVNTNPPRVDAGGGAAYDPSGKANDSLWDIGQ
jgi:type II secretory pathway pseudopilin PulG